jgi:hypothetical protein
VLLLVLRSLKSHLFVPGGDCKLALPVFDTPVTEARTRRSIVLCSNPYVLPCAVILPLPVYVTPLQQIR